MNNSKKHVTLLEDVCLLKKNSKIGKSKLPKPTLKPKWSCAINIQDNKIYLYLRNKEIKREEIKDKKVSIISVNALSSGSAESQAKSRSRELFKKFNQTSTNPTFIIQHI